MQYCEQGVRDGLCGLVGSLGNDAVACPALCKREQNGTAADLAADRGLVTIQGVGNPALAQSHTVNLETLAVRTAEYCTSDNPPILHRKETLVTERGFNS